MTASWQPGWPPGQQLGMLLGGSSAFSTKTANYDLTTADGYIEADATTQSIVLTLPDATGCAGTAFTVIRSDAVTATNLVTITTLSGQTIDGAAAQLLVFQYHWISVLSDGANWLIIGNNYPGTELGLSQAFTTYTTLNTVTSDSALAAGKIPGMSITVTGAGRPVEIEFTASAYNTTPNTATAATLLINGSQSNGITSAVSSPETTTTPIAYRTLYFKLRPLLTAGTPYTFEVGMWCQGGQGGYFASTNALAAYVTSLSVVGK